MKQILIKPNFYKKAKIKSLWYYKNEIASPLKNYTPGEEVLVYLQNYQKPSPSREKRLKLVKNINNSPSALNFIGKGYVNPDSIIAVRILSFDPEERINTDFFKQRIKQALIKRLNYFFKNSNNQLSNMKIIQLITNAFRIVHSEADLLSGLIIDYYNGIIVIEINTVGIYKKRNDIIKALKETIPQFPLLNIKDIIIKINNHISTEFKSVNIENNIIFLKSSNQPPQTTITEKATLDIGTIENRFVINFASIQKTGFYLDQRENKKIFLQYLQQYLIEQIFKTSNTHTIPIQQTKKIRYYLNILDAFSHTGAFSIWALNFLPIFEQYLKKQYKIQANIIPQFILNDISQTAIGMIKQNLEINNIDPISPQNFIKIIKQDSFSYLKELIKNSHLNYFDFIILDPPSFTKTAKDRPNAIRGFKYLILNALKLLKPNGFILLFSCSYHISIEDLITTTQKAARDGEYIVEIKNFMFQDFRDHPFVANYHNSFYLKGLVIKKQ